VFQPAVDAGWNTYFYINEIIDMAKKKQKQEATSDFVPVGTILSCDPSLNVGLIPTCIPCLDHVLGGGFGTRRLAEIYGPPGSGKSAICYHMLRHVILTGGISVLLDNEGAFNPQFFRSLGGDPAKLYMASEDETITTEAVLDFLKANSEKYAELGLNVPPLLMVWDSIAATGTKHLQETDAGKRDLSKSVAMSQGLQRLLPHVRNSNTCILCINQTYQVIGSYVPTVTTGGGDRLKFIASQRLHMTYNTSDHIYDDKKQHIGHRVVAKVEKSRLGNPHQRTSLYFYTVAGAKHPLYGYDTKFGFDVAQSLFDYYQNGAFRMEDGKRVVEQKGAWYVLHEAIDSAQKSFRGKDWPEKLEQFPELTKLLYYDLEVDPETIVV